MKQSAITIVAPLDTQHQTGAVFARLSALGDAVHEGRLVSLTQLIEAQRVHFLSFFMFGGPELGLMGTQPPPSQAFVVLEVNADGKRSEVLRLIAERAPEFLAELFHECSGLPAPAAQGGWFDFLSAHDVGADAFYLGHPGRSVQQIARERRLRASASQWLDHARRETDASDTWRELQRDLKGDLDRLGPAPRLPFWVRWSFHPQAGPRRLRFLSSWLGRVSFVLGILAGLAALFWLPHSTLFRSVVAALVFIGSCPMLTSWIRERPRRAKGYARLQIWAVMIRDWLLLVMGISGSLGLLSLAPYVIRYAHLVRTPLISTAGLVTAALVGTFAGLAAGSRAGWTLGLVTLAAWSCAVYSLWQSPACLAFTWLVATGVALATMLILVARFLVLLRRSEVNDVQPELNWDLETLERCTQREDIQLQNHLATVTELRPDRIRRYALRVVLRAVALLSKVYFNQGTLDDISSIHFGRFVIHSHAGTERLLFMGNYDGGFSTYLGAFSSVLGTTAVWSCTHGFPRTFLLVEDGARDEQRFKAFGRHSQVPTLGWYSAYPDVSTQDVLSGSATHEDLGRRPAQPARATWYALLRPFWSGPELRGPFDEAACDAALRRL
ncbi:MAG TPA: hypothetical protein VJV78_35785 [Polyangiales bacterium]|nr:hypothetical protein [Polyangiales bacterium]